MRIKYIACLTLSLTIFASNAQAQNCAENETLQSYEIERDHGLREFDNLNNEQRELLLAAYGIAKDAAAESVSEVAGNPIPLDLLTNMGNIKKILSNDRKTSIEGSMGIYGGIVGKLSPSLGEALPSMFQAMIDGLSTSNQEFIRRQDEKNRMKGELSLPQECKGEIAKLPRYSPPRPNAYMSRSISALDMSEFATSDFNIKSPYSDDQGIIHQTGVGIGATNIPDDYACGGRIDVHAIVFNSEYEATQHYHNALSKNSNELTGFYLSTPPIKDGAMAGKKGSKLGHYIYKNAYEIISYERNAFVMGTAHYSDDCALFFDLPPTQSSLPGIIRETYNILSN